MSTLKATNLQNASSSSTNLALDTSGNATSAGTVVMSSPYTMRNKIINGAMVIDQRNNGASTTTSSGYAYGTDRNRSYVGTPTARWTCQRSTDAPAGFSNSFLVTTTTAQTSFAASDLGVPLEQAVEGYNITDLSWGTVSAKSVTVSFWIKASIAGSYAVSIFNSNAGTIDRSYPTSVTVSLVNTWEYKTITVPGDTTGVWQTANNIGLYLAIAAFGGSNFLGTANTWQSGLREYPSGCVNITSAVGATLYITGVQLERGTVATPFEYRNYQQELAMCQRYCFKMSTTGNYGPYGMGHGINTTAFRAIIKTAQTMRAQPTLSFTTASGFQWSFGNALSAIAAADYGLDAFSVDCTSTGIAANGGYLLTSANNTTSSITATAEL